MHISNKLIQRVRRIDPQAAAYLQQVNDENPTSNFNISWISSCFVWSDTPQGHKYWWRIEDILAGNVPFEYKTIKGNQLISKGDK